LILAISNQKTFDRS